FAAHFRVIAPNIPQTIKTMDDAANGFAAILQAENIQQAHLVGMSFGAALAQIFIRRYRQLVTDTILTHTVIPSIHLAEHVAMQRNLMRLYPAPFLLWLSRRTFRHNITHSSSGAVTNNR